MSAPQSPTAARPQVAQSAVGRVETYDARRIRTNVGVGNKAENDKAVFIHFQCDTEAQATALWRALYAMWQAGHFKIETKSPQAAKR